MKKNHLRGFYKNPCILLSVFVLLLASSCKKNSEDIIDTQPDNETETLTNYLVSKGFDKDQIVYDNDRVIVENDIILSLKELKERVAKENLEPGNPDTEHRRHNYLVSNSYNSNIRVWIDPGVPSSWVSAVQSAINNWNAINGTKLGMSLVSSQSQAHCRVFMGYQNASWVARAYLPTSNGRPGVSVEINSYYNGLSASYKIFTITHEFGHTVGFHHTNQTSGIFISGTPSSDPNSVMNSFILPWAGFTSGDVLATQILYPL